MLYFFIAFHGIILSLLVAFQSRYGTPRANRFLGGLILSIALCLGELGLYATGLFKEFPHFIAVTAPIFFSIPLLFYLHIKERFNCKIVWKDLIGLIPATLYTIFAIPFYLLDGGIKLAIVGNPENEYFILSDLWSYVYLTLSILYSGLSAKLVSSPKHKSDSKWLFLIILLYLILSIADLVFILLIKLQPEFKVVAPQVITIVQAILIQVIGYLIILEPKIFFDLRPGRYRRSTLSESASKDILKKILVHMEKNKPYLDGELKMWQLAKDMGLSPNQLSQILNQELKKTFNEFINEYRILEVKIRLKDIKYRNLTIYSIAVDSGFNSKNTFNRIFKSYMGITPREYIKSERSNYDSSMVKYD